MGANSVHKVKFVRTCRPKINGTKDTYVFKEMICLINVSPEVIKIIKFLSYLIIMFLCFVFRRKRKGKGAKGRARSGGRGHQKGSKQQGKAAQPSPTTCSALPKPPVTEDNQSEQRQQTDEPNGVSPSTNEVTEDTTKTSTGWKTIGILMHEHKMS